MAFIRDLDNIIPIMSANTVPSGYIASASSYYGAGRDAFSAFDGTNTGDADNWLTPSGVLTGWLAIELPIAKIVNKYKITCHTAGNTWMPKNWTFDGWTGSVWVTIDTQVGYVGFTAGNTSSFVFNNTNAYKKYRVNVTLNNGAPDYVCIAQLELCSTGQYSSLIPKMTSNTSTSGTASASTVSSDQYVYRAFDNLYDGGNSWCATTTTGWIQYQFSVAKVVKQYSIVGQAAVPTRAPRDFTFLGSNDGINFTILDTQSGIVTTNWSGQQANTFSISNSSAYLYYRLNITANNGEANYVNICELRMFGYGDPCNRWELTKNANDSAGSLNLTNNGGVNFLGGQGASFNGSSQWLSGTKTVPTNFTLSLWVKVSSMPATALCPMTWGESNGAQAVGFYLEPSSGKEMAFESGGLYFRSTANSPTYSSTTYTNIVMTYDGTMVRYYRSGIEISGSILGTTAARSTNFSIGRYGINSSTNFYMNGSTLDARIYDYPITSTEVAVIYSAGPNNVNTKPLHPTSTGSFRATVCPINYDRVIMDNGSSRFGINKEGKVYLKNLSNTYTAQGNTVLPKSKTTTLAAVYNAGVNNIYIDGVADTVKIAGVDDSYTKSLLHFDNGIIDESGKIWTSYGGATTNTTQSRFGGSSLYLDGVDDYLSTPDNVDFEFISSDFSIDFWVNKTNASNSTVLIGQGEWANPDSSASFMISLVNNTLRTDYYYGGSTSQYYAQQGSTSIVNNTWNHIAVCKQGGTIYHFINGILVSTKSDYGTTALQNPSGIWFIGKSTSGGSTYFGGYIDEVRISKGIARWTSNFVPPTVPYPVVTKIDDIGTKSLLHFNVAKDETGKILTPYGGADTNTGKSKFSGRSLYLNGSQYVQTPFTNDFDFGSGDFTIDMWVYPLLDTSQLFVTQKRMDTHSGVSIYLTGGFVNIVSSTTGNSWNINFSTSAYTLNQWNHIALIRSGNNWYSAVNGVLSNPVSASGNIPVALAEVASIGACSDGTSKFTGYIDEFRVSKGTARWTSNFTPPTSPYILDANTVFLWHCDDYSIDPLRDETDRKWTINGNIIPLTTQYKFGSSACYFNGSTQYINAVDAALAPGGMDWTWDCWVKPDSYLNAQNTIIEIATGQAGNPFHHLSIRNSTSKFYYVLYDSGAYRITMDGTSVVSTSSWTHVAVTKCGDTYRLFVNGILENVGIWATAITAGMNNICIGQEWNNHKYKGFIDEVRIVMGKAMWTSNFTPPDAPYVSMPISFIKTDDPLLIGMGNPISDVEVWTTAISGTDLTSIHQGYEDGLEGLWSMQEGYGDIVHDNTPNNNAGTINSGEKWQVPSNTGHTYELQLSSNADYIVIDDNSSLQLTANKTLMIEFVNLKMASNITPLFMKRVVGSGAAAEYDFYINSNGKLEFCVGNNSSNSYTPDTSNFKFEEGKRYKVAVTHNTETNRVSFYCNGKLLSSANMANLYGTVKTKLYLGYINNGTVYPLNGRLNNAKIFNRVLSDNEIKAISNDMPYSTTGLVLDLPMDEGYGYGLVKDRSGYGNDGTIKGAQWVLKDRSSIKLDGVDDYIVFPVHTNLPKNTGTIEIKFNQSGTSPTGDSVLFQLGTTARAGTTYHIIYTTTGNKVRYYNGTDLEMGTVINNVTDCLASVSFNNNVQLCYIDGVYTATGALTNALVLETLQLGRYSTGSGYSKNITKEVRIWNYARSAAEITAYKDIELTGNETGLVFYWKGEITSDGKYAIDRSPYANHGTIVGCTIDKSSVSTAKQMTERRIIG